MKTLVTLKISILQILLLLISANVFAYGRNTPLQGYNWYNEKPEEPKKKSTEDKKASKSAPQDESQLPEYEKNIRSLKARHEQAHRRALDNPTLENILAELILEKEMINKSQTYSERRVAVSLLASQFIDMKEHSNILHKKVQEEVEAQEISLKLASLSKSWGLLLQVDEKCTHSHAFAPIILEFAQKHNFELLAASKSGKDFHNIAGVDDQGEMSAFNPKQETPILYLIKSDGTQVFPISRGINSEDQIIANIWNIDKHIFRVFE